MYFNTLYTKSKIYKITFEQNDKIYIGSTCRELPDRLDGHKTCQKSAVYKYRDCGPHIELIVDCPSKGKRALEDAGQPRARIGPGDTWDRGPLNVSDDWKQWRFETIFYTHYCNSSRGSYF